MTIREERTRALLEAAARHHDVDTGRLWSRVEAGLDVADRHHEDSSRSRLAVAAAAAVTIGLVGATLWASSRGDAPTPLAATTSTGTASTTPPPPPSTTTSPSPTGTTGATSAPAPTAPTGVPTARPALSTASLLTASDYRAAGWIADSVTASQGWGQSPISACQYALPPAREIGFPVFRADGYPAAFGLQLAAYQYALEPPTTALAEELVKVVLAWPDGCGARVQESITSSPVRSVELPGGHEGQWYTVSSVQPSGFRHDELVAVVRDENRISVVVLHETSGSRAIDAVDAAELLRRSAGRLG